MAYAKKTSLLLLILTLLTSAPAAAQSINWVTFPTWIDESLTGTGTSADLDVAATFTLLSGTFDERPVYRPESASINDPIWPYTNTTVPALSAIGVNGGLISYEVRFDYTNTGGLPAGGSIVVIDLEAGMSIVEIQGLVSGAVVPVQWDVSFLEVNGNNAEFPLWDPGTATLSGNDDVDTSTRNLVFLSSDRALDAVEFAVSGPRDGIDFGTAAQTVTLAAPAPALDPLVALTLAALLTAAAVLTGLRRPATHL